MAIERLVISLSLSPANPDAARVLAALRTEDIPERRRSAVLLAWLAAYLDGQARSRTAGDAGLSEAELDALLEDF